MHIVPMILVTCSYQTILRIWRDPRRLISVLFLFIFNTLHSFSFSWRSPKRKLVVEFLSFSFHGPFVSRLNLSIFLSTSFFCCVKDQRFDWNHKSVWQKRLKFDWPSRWSDRLNVSSSEWFLSLEMKNLLNKFNFCCHFKTQLIICTLLQHLKYILLKNFVCHKRLNL